MLADEMKLIVNSVLATTFFVAYAEIDKYIGRLSVKVKTVFYDNE